MAIDIPTIQLPADLLPTDGRFGSGPSKVRPEAISALSEQAAVYLGTSHRQATVRFVVGALRNGLAELFALPDGYEILLGNGGTTSFWDALAFGVLDRRSQHLAFGEFSSKFVSVVRAAPWLDEPDVIEADYGRHPTATANDDVDAYALTHNETSTGVVMPIERPEGVGPEDGLVLVDATSAAGGVRFDAAQTDVYYFAPQKCLASDGGLWLAACSPAAIERIERIAASDRYVPASLDLGIALENSRKDQTYNTQALATVFLAVEQVEWILGNGGLEWAAARCERSSGILYDWAESCPVATPFVADPADRSPVVATIDFDESIEASILSAVLRANGIVDTEAYRKLGRNQIRVATYPAIDPDDVEALTRCLDHLIAEFS